MALKVDQWIYIIALLLRVLLSQGASFVFVEPPTTRRALRVSRHRNKAFLGSVSEDEVVRRFQEQLIKLRQRDRAARRLEKEDLEVCFEDEHLLVVNKPSRVLCVPSEEGLPSLSQTVFERCRNAKDGRLKVNTMDQMVVHRLGMDTSGLVVFAKTMESLRGLNTLFRTRQVTRQYEALVCGHVEAFDASNADGEFGWITFPLMRDWENPPFMRVSTEENQKVLVGLDPAIVGKRLLQAPKQSLTKYLVLEREYLHHEGSTKNEGGLPVTRLALTAITGRTHQLNVHLAAFGHHIVGDEIYGLGGDAGPDGGLDLDSLQRVNRWRASRDLQEQISALVAAKNMNMCVHAKHISFRHPVTRQDVSFSSTVPF